MADLTTPEPGPVGGASVDPSPTQLLSVIYDEVAVTPADALTQWRSALGAVQIPDTLLVLGELTSALDLTHAHPSGQATFLAGRSTRLSSLIRDPGTLGSARRQVRAIRHRAGALALEQGVRGLFLGAGLARWRPALDPAHSKASLSDETIELISAPVLLRGCSIRPAGASHEDYDLELDSTVVVNPVLLRRLSSEYGIRLDAVALAGLAFGVDGFDPAPVYARLEAACGTIPGFHIDHRLLAGLFTGGSGSLLGDLELSVDALRSHALIGPLMAESAAEAAALVAGGASGTESGVPGQSPRPAEPIVLSGEIDLASHDEAGAEGGAFDLDPAQRSAVRAVLAGEHLALHGPPGSGLTHTLAASVAGLVSQGRSVLIVTPHRATADQLLARLADHGLGEIALDLHDGWGDRLRTLTGIAGSLGAAMAGEGAGLARRAEQAIAEATTVFDQARDRLAGDGEALHALRQPWGVSAYQAMVALAELMSGLQPPRTTVRLPMDVTRRLDRGARDALCSDLAEAAGLGAFTMTRVETRWLDARVHTEADAELALRAARTARDGLARARACMNAIAESAGIAPADTVAQWRPQLDLLLGVRSTLDVLLPTVFEQGLDDVIAITAPGGVVFGLDGQPLGRGEKRHLKKRARAFVRPGVHVSDLNRVLIAAQEQHRRWHAIALSEALPRVPAGLTEGAALVGAVEGALRVLAGVLAGTGAPDMLSEPLDKVEYRLADLAIDESGLRAQPRRTVLLRRLVEAGLGDLISDLRERRAGETEIQGELELAWWTSVLEAIIREDPRLARHDSGARRRAVQALRAGDQALMAASADAVRAQVLLQAQGACEDHVEQARWLRAEASRGHRSAWPIDLFRQSPHVLSALRPVWVMSPDAVARLLPPAQPDLPVVDVVVVDDAGQVGMAHAAAALSRGVQIIVAGDQHRLPPSTGGPSVLEVISRAVGVRRLDRDHRARDARLMAPLREIYQQPWLSLRGADGRGGLSLSLVPDGVAVPAQGEEVPLSADAEVARVVDLVTAHALMHPGESLAVVTLGMRHAERIEASLRSAAGDRPALAQWLDLHWTGPVAEPFVVRPVHRLAGLERDAVIVSIGFARTPHQRVVHRFGVLDGRYGRACLAAALSRSRSRTTVVCCYGADDLDLDRVRTEGARMLHAVLAAAAQGSPSSAPVVEGASESEDGAASGSGEAPTQILKSSIAARSAVLASLPDRIARGELADALAADLCKRLYVAGLPVITGLEAPDWPVGLAVADPSTPGGVLVAVELDGPVFASCASIRLRDRQRLQMFERAGYITVRIAAMDLFVDPNGEVERIRDAWRAAGGLPTSVLPASVLPMEPKLRGAWPSTVSPGLPISAYSADELDDVVAWVVSDAIERTDEIVAGEVRAALGFAVRSPRIDANIESAVRRVLLGLSDEDPNGTIDVQLRRNAIVAARWSTFS